jgi:hypothetical protein
MDGTNFALDMSSLCLVFLSVLARDVPARAVDEEACTPLVDEAWTPVEILLSDMTLSFIKSRRTSLMDSSSAVSSSEYTLEKDKWGHDDLKILH